MTLFDAVLTCARRSLSLAAPFLLALSAVATATDYYVDSAAGDDKASGKSPETAWKTLDRVSEAKELAPGDAVKFKSGSIWRGGLKPRSGEPNKPIVYTSYGTGAKPSFWRSVALDVEAAWVRAGENLWATRTTEVRKVGPADGFLSGKGWSLHQEGGAKVQYEAKDSRYVFVGGNFGTKPNNVQWMNSPFPIEKGRCYRLSADVKSTKPVDILPSLMMAGSPWSSYGDVAYGAIHGEPQPTRQTVVFRSRVDAKDARVTFYMGGLPEDTTVEISNIAVDEVAIDAFDFGPDVGNIILDGKKAAFKRWTREDLKSQDDFWFDRREGRVFFYSKENPAKTYRTLEAAVMLHVIDHSSVHDAVFDGLDLRYGAAHGFGGASSKRLIIRNCDISWIGGGDQYRGGGEGRRVRYGNGIEFWADAEDNLVENCRLWEVYDAAITNQGSGTNVEKNIVYRDNLIWNCEYSFEYWNRDETSKTENVSFVDNVCLNAGYGWGHVQRPDPNGRCLMFYSNTAQTKNFLVKGNVFANATESLVRSDAAWTPEQPVLAENVYSQENQALPYVLWRKEKIFRDGFDAWRKDAGEEKGAKLEKIDAASLIPKNDAVLDGLTK